MLKYKIPQIVTLTRNRGNEKNNFFIRTTGFKKEKR